ncbi:hypothetical protein C7974DRAFT_434591 [Boeremia exigua]|uniref:uncharacterized protein n=1 Tax=Boeremia exigua TaxID=749465 RepID=UPI001E8E735B|nr:uncharacterized protein C7974DRAFT_434591 [Boeremia exigua]KAH6625536.1 hypothetical protein C7974DRAFT_434591 [Boeremia exigua]
MAPLSEIIDMLIGQAFGKLRIPDLNLTGKTIIVTGANTGLGLECVKHLMRLQASHIVLACRDVKKGQAAVQKIREEIKYGDSTKLEVWDLDLSSYDSVLAFNKRVDTELYRLDAFIANAGMEVQTFQVAENIEKHLTVNVVSCFMSAIACLPLLRKTSRDFDTHCTLTFCGSMYHIFGPDSEFDAAMTEDADMFDALSDPTRTDIIWRYALSKLMVHQCFHELVAQVRNGVEHTDSRVVVNIVNPGWCGTELSRAKPSNLGEKFCFALMGWTAEKGSRIYLHALAGGQKSHGQYLSEGSPKIESQYVRSDRGRRIQVKMWKDLVSRMEKVAPEVAGLVT